MEKIISLRLYEENIVMFDFDEIKTTNYIFEIKIYFTSLRKTK